MMETYRWSDEVEAQFRSLMSVGASALLVSEQIGCSERMARRLVLRWRSGLPLNMEPKRVIPTSSVPRTVPRRKSGRPGSAWATNIMNASPEQREKKRRTVLPRLSLGESVERVSAGTHVPVSVIREWIAAEQGDDGASGMTVVEEPTFLPWPKVGFNIDDWPAHARFEDSLAAPEWEPRWRPPAHAIPDRMSYCSNATAWL